MGWDPCELFLLPYSGVADAEAFPIPLGYPAAPRSYPTLQK